MTHAASAFGVPNPVASDGDDGSGDPMITEHFRGPTLAPRDSSHAGDVLDAERLHGLVEAFNVQALKNGLDYLSDVRLTALEERVDRIDTMQSTQPAPSPRDVVWEKLVTTPESSSGDAPEALAAEEDVASFSAETITVALLRNTERLYELERFVANTMADARVLEQERMRQITRQLDSIEKRLPSRIRDDERDIYYYGDVRAV